MKAKAIKDLGLFFGKTGAGKTSVIKLINEIAKSKNQRVIFVEDLQELKQKEVKHEKDFC